MKTRAEILREIASELEAAIEHSAKAARLMDEALGLQKCADDIRNRSAGDLVVAEMLRGLAWKAEKVEAGISAETPNIGTDEKEEVTGGPRGGRLFPGEPK